MSPLADRLDRTIKIDLDSGRASTVAEAEQLARSRILQVAVGADVDGDETAQAALYTIVNAGARAFHGGVRVAGAGEWACVSPWASGSSAAGAVARFGGAVVDRSMFSDRHPTIVVGTVERTPAIGSVVIHVTWDRWVAAVVTSSAARLDERPFPLAGVAAGSLAVAESFSHDTGSVVAGRRDVGISLWRPEVPWHSPDACGPVIDYVPSKLWILGLGHLGQAHLWTVGCLPYTAPEDVELWLVDYDTVVDANRSTGLLVSADTPPGSLKSRVCAARVEQLGFRTRLVERAFGEGSCPSAGEPRWALVGFDSPAPRRHLGVFDVAVDVGIGASADDYRGIHIHGFPAAGDPSKIFGDQPTPTRRSRAPWADAAADDDCGVVQLSGVAVGASFVGAFAASMSVAEILRLIAGEPATAVVSCSVGSVGDVDVVRSQVTARNPGVQSARAV